MGCRPAVDPLSQIHCTQCNDAWIAHIQRRLCKYQLPDWRQCTLDWVLGWCRECSNFQRIEALPSKDDLLVRQEKAHARLVAAWAKTKGFLGKLRERFYSYQIANNIVKAQRALDEARNAFVWHDLRRSPPRCLECSTTAVEYIDWQQPESLSAFSHPGCAGTLTVGEGKTRRLIPEPSIYDVEGYFLYHGRPCLPPSHQHPIKESETERIAECQG